MITNEKEYADILIKRGIDISKMDIKKLINDGFDVSQETIDEAIDKYDNKLRERIRDDIATRNHLGVPIGVNEKFIVFTRHVIER